MKPLPLVNADTAHYWSGAAAGELRYRVCGNCSVTLPWPHSSCSECGEITFDWRVSAGRGRVASFTVVHRAPTPEFEVPYVIALVDFDEGFRLMLNVLGEDAGSTAIGDMVELVFEPRGVDGQQLPQVQRVSDR